MVYFRDGVISLTCALNLISKIYCHPTEHIALVKTRADQLDSTYDYITVGGGTSSLTVADRLTEDRTKSVLVVEYGPLETNPDILLPAIGLINFPADIRDPGTRLQFSAEEQLLEVDQLLISVTFTPPSEELQAQYNITYNMSAYGQNGPVQSSFPPYQWPTTHSQWRGWKSLGIPAQQEGAGDAAYGLIRIPASMDSKKKQTRSYSRTRHYESIMRRPNYYLLTSYHAKNIILSTNFTAEGVQIQLRDYNGSIAKISTVFARNEVILAASSIGTPLILQRSGIGPMKVLQKAGINVKVNSPGVGQNLQDHSVLVLGYNYQIPSHDTLSSNATFLSESLLEYHENKTGPITGADGDAGAFLTLATVTSQYQKLIEEARSQNASLYLFQEYDPAVLKGFEARKKILLNSYASNTTAVIEVPMTGADSNSDLGTGS